MRPDAPKSVNIGDQIKEMLNKDESPEHLMGILHKLEDYVPTIPDTVTLNYLQAAGFDTTDPRIIRIVAIMVQKMISDIANDALQQTKIRTLNQPVKGNKPKERRYHLTMDDLAATLTEYNINVRKPPYFV